MAEVVGAVGNIGEGAAGPPQQAAGQGLPMQPQALEPGQEARDEAPPAPDAPPGGGVGAAGAEDGYDAGVGGGHAADRPGGL